MVEIDLAMLPRRRLVMMEAIAVVDKSGGQLDNATCTAFDGRTAGQEGRYTKCMVLVSTYLADALVHLLSAIQLKQ